MSQSSTHPQSPPPHTHTHTSLLLVGAETVGDVSRGIVHHQTLHFPAVQPSHSLRLHHHTRLDRDLQCLTHTLTTKLF